MSDTQQKPTKNNNAVIEGAVYRVGEVQTVGTRGAQKRVVVVETAGDYPQKIPCEFFGKNLDKADRLAVGDEVLIAVNLRGREANGKFYGSNDAWHVKVTRSASPPPNVASPDDDLPFATCAIGHEPSAVWRHFR